MMHSLFFMLISEIVLLDFSVHLDYVMQRVERK